MNPCATTKESKLGNGPARYLETTTTTTKTTTMERMTARVNGTEIG